MVIPAIAIAHFAHHLTVLKIFDSALCGLSCFSPPFGVSAGICVSAAITSFGIFRLLLQLACSAKVGIIFPKSISTKRCLRYTTLYTKQNTFLQKIILFIINNFNMLITLTWRDYCLRFKEIQIFYKKQSDINITRLTQPQASLLSNTHPPRQTLPPIS